MNKTLLTGKPYVKSCDTDLRKTFARIRKQQKEQQEKEREQSLERIAKVRTIR